MSSKLLDPEWFARICPGKAKMHGQQLYFDAMAYCAGLHGANGARLSGLPPALAPDWRAPNIEVSLVVTPHETALLADRTLGFYAYEAYRRLARIAAGPIFRQRMRPTG